MRPAHCNPSLTVPGLCRGKRRGRWNRPGTICCSPTGRLHQTCCARSCPTELPLDAFDGQCWIGVVPFRMSGISRPRPTPNPWTIAFSRTERPHLCHGLGGKPGVYFFSLDAANLPAVWAARTLLPAALFSRAHVCHRWPWEKRSHIRRSAVMVSVRNFTDATIPFSPVWCCEEKEQSGALVQRTLLPLYPACQEDVYRAEIHHEPWPLQDAQAEIRSKYDGASCGEFFLPTSIPLLHFAKKLEVLIWPLRDVSNTA